MLARSSFAPALVGGALLLACNDPTPGERADAASGPATLVDASPDAAGIDRRDAGAESDAYAPVFDDLPAPVLSAWGPDVEHVFFVGEGGLVIERSGASWQRHLVPTEQSLWWVWGSALDDVFAGGEGGALLHFDGDGWRLLDAGLDAQQTIWGIWGVGKRRFLVGGRAQTNGPGFVIEGDGTSWDRLTTAASNLYKVWGRNARQIYVVGGDSSLFSLEGSDLVELDLGASGANPDPLFTISGNDETAFAVGGVTEGLAFEGSGADFEPVPFSTGGLNGVSVSPSGVVVVVGLFGVVRERRRGIWSEHDLFVERHYHAALGFDDGAYAMGGDLLASGSERRGLIVARGKAFVSGAELAPPALPGDGGVPDDAGTIDAGPERGATGEPDATASTEPEVDAGLDAGRPQRPDALDAGAVDAGLDAAAPSGPPGAGEVCGEDYTCAPGLECWYIQGQGELRCVPFCDAPTDCPASFGADPKCAPPGCQTTLQVCLRAEWEGCFL